MTIDVEVLRDHLLELCGTAAFACLGAALADASDIERASSEELLAIALRLGVDPTEFETR